MCASLIGRLKRNTVLPRVFLFGHFEHSRCLSTLTTPVTLVVRDKPTPLSGHLHVRFNLKVQSRPF